MEKICRCLPDASCRPLFNFCKWLEIQPMYSRHSFGNKKLWKRIIKNPQKIKLHFVYSQPLFIVTTMKNKRGLELVTGSFSGCQPNKFVNYLSLVILTVNRDALIKRGFWVTPKITICNWYKLFMTSKYSILNFFLFNLKTLKWEKLQNS